MHHVLRSMQTMRREARIWVASLQLGAILVYMWNALNHREAEGRAENALKSTSCQHIPAENEDSDDEEDGTEPVTVARGLYFLSDIVGDQHGYRLPTTRLVDWQTLGVLYRTNGKAGIMQAFRITALCRPMTAGHRSRVPNRIKGTLPVQNVMEQEAVAVAQLHFAEAGVEIRPRLRMHGPDVEEMIVDDVGEDQDNDDVDRIITTILKQFPYDVFQVCANRKSTRDGSWTLLNTRQRAQVTVEVFKTLDMSEVFADIQYRIVDMKFWRETMFPRYFPPKGFQPPFGQQNFPYTTYYSEWLELMGRLSERDANLVRSRVYTQFFEQLWWLPHGGSDRMWATKTQRSREWTRLPVGHGGPCPQIAVNRRWMVGEPITLGGAGDHVDTEPEEQEEGGARDAGRRGAAAQRQEEEEGSD
jgi:hypothetical protein